MDDRVYRLLLRIVVGRELNDEWTPISVVLEAKQLLEEERARRAAEEQK